jgi:hypothetical protein
MLTLTAPPIWDIPTLNVFIAQQENFLRAPLVGIRAEGDGTVLDFDDETSQKPATNTEVTIDSPPRGARVVASARILVNNTPALAIAYRRE